MTELLTALWSVVVQLFANPQSQAVLIALGIGGFGTEFVAHMLPSRMEPPQSDRIVRLISLGLAWITAFHLVTTPTGFFMGLFAGLSAPTLYETATRIAYARWPSLKPEALKKCEPML